MKKKRAPGGGRKPAADKMQSFQVRIQQSLMQDLDQLDGKKADEIRWAIKHWVNRFRRESVHVEALCSMVGWLATEIENRRPGKRWIDDPEVGAAVRQGVEKLVSHFAPLSEETVAPDLDLAPFVITAIESARLHTARELINPDSEVAKLGAHTGYWAGNEFARLFHDLGSGFERNRDITTGRK